MISIVIPAHNEADERGRLLEAFSAFAHVDLIVARGSVRNSFDKTYTNGDTYYDKGVGL